MICCRPFSPPRPRVRKTSPATSRCPISRSSSKRSTTVCTKHPTWPACRRCCADIESGAIELVSLDSREPSPFAHELLNANPYAFLDDAPLEERRARAVTMRRTLSAEALSDLGRLDPEAIALVKSEAWPLVRDADELHDVLLSLGALPISEGQALAQFLRRASVDGPGRGGSWHGRAALVGGDRTLAAGAGGLARSSHPAGGERAGGSAPGLATGGSYLVSGAWAHGVCRPDDGRDAGA